MNLANYRCGLSMVYKGNYVQTTWGGGLHEKLHLSLIEQERLYMNLLENRLTDGSEVVRFKRLSTVYPPETSSGTHFC
jgi:hypothetical protein